MPAGTNYPPEDHLGRDLGITYRIPSADRITLTAACTEHLLRSDGTVSSEAVCAIVDEAIGFVAVLAVLPDWGSTAALTLGFTGVSVEPRGELVVEGAVLKAGKRLVFSECTVTWEGTLVAHAQGQFARVGRAGSNVDMEVPQPDPSVTFEMGPAASGLDRCLSDRLGFRRSPRGSIEIDFGPYMANSSGLLHGGVAAALAICAAEEVAGAPAGNASIQFLAAGRQGPFVAEGRGFPGERPGVWRTETRDSAGGTLMNTAVVRTV